VRKLHAEHSDEDIAFELYQSQYVTGCASALISSAPGTASSRHSTPRFRLPASAVPPHEGSLSYPAWKALAVGPPPKPDPSFFRLVELGAIRLHRDETGAPMHWRWRANSRVTEQSLVSTYLLVAAYLSKRQRLRRAIPVAHPHRTRAACPALPPPGARPLVGGGSPIVLWTFVALSGGDVTESAIAEGFPTVTGFAVKCAIAALRKYDEAAWPLFHRADLSEQEFVSPKRRLPAAVQGEFLEFAAEAVGDTAFGLHLAQESNPREAGLLFYVASAASTFGEALPLFARYFGIVNESVRFRVVRRHSGVIVEFNFVGVSQDRVKQNTEFLLALIVKAAREVTNRDIRPTRVVCPHVRNEDLREFERFFGCPVEFGAPSGQLTFSKETLALPLLTGDPHLLELLRPFCEDAERARNTTIGSFRASVENEIERLLPHAQAKAETVAKALALSVAAMSRRMSDEGTTFGEVVDQLRRGLAFQYLKEPGFTLAQIAWLLGYGRPLSLRYAFKRWTGRPPSAVRNDNLRSTAA
jgi:AraC-like DNA-binding protein